MKLKILKYPHPLLRKKANPVPEGQTPCDLIDSMKAVLLKEKGLGLAATQVGVSQRVVLIEHNNQLLTMINPVILKTNGDKYPSREGCLSVPGVYGEVPRYQSLQLKYKNALNQEMIIDAFGQLAEAVQHEIDHLDGILFIDKMSNKDLKRNKSALYRLKKKFKPS